MEAINIQTSNINHDVISGKVVENIAQGLVTEGQIPGQSHYETRNHRDASREVSDPCKPIHGRFSQ